MSAVFKKPKTQVVRAPMPVEPQIADENEEIRAFERKRKKRMGAVSQILSDHNEKIKLGA